MLQQYNPLSPYRLVKGIDLAAQGSSSCLYFQLKIQYIKTHQKCFSVTFYVSQTFFFHPSLQYTTSLATTKSA